MIPISNALLKTYALMVFAALSMFLIGCGQDSENSALLESSSESKSQSAPESELSQAPDFNLPAANKGTEISLSQYRGDKSVVLVFYRAYW